MILTSVIKVEPEQITLEDDSTGENYVIPMAEFPIIEQGIQMGQIFEVNLEKGEIRFNEEETLSRRERVASLLAQLNKV